MTDREVSKGIVANPNRCGGLPTIEGTRCTAEMVANVAATPEGIELMLRDYDFLTTLDIANARGWDRREGRADARHTNQGGTRWRVISATFAKSE